MVSDASEITRVSTADIYCTLAQRQLRQRDRFFMWPGAWAVTVVACCILHAAPPFPASTAPTFRLSQTLDGMAVLTGTASAAAVAVSSTAAEFWRLAPILVAISASYAVPTATVNTIPPLAAAGCTTGLGVWLLWTMYTSNLEGYSIALVVVHLVCVVGGELIPRVCRPIAIDEAAPPQAPPLIPKQTYRF
jgi:hypothetical protein